MSEINLDTALAIAHGALAAGRELSTAPLTVAVLDALSIALEEKTRLNTAMLGAVARVCPFLDPDAIKATIAQQLRAHHPGLVEANLRTFDRGFRELQTQTWPAEPGDPGRPVQRAASSFGYLDAPPGGPDWGLRFVLTLLYPK